MERERVLIYIYHPLLIFTEYFYYKNRCCIIQLHRTALGHLYSQIYARDWVKTKSILKDNKIKKFKNFPRTQQNMTITTLQTPFTVLC